MRQRKAAIGKNWWTKEAQAKPELTRMVHLLEQAKISKAEDLPQLISAREAAPYLKVHYKTAADMLAKQVVRSVKLRGRRFTTPEWIADYFRKALGHG